MSHTFSLTGIVIKRRNYREADKWLTVFSSEKGKIDVLARGIRKITSKRSGQLELFNLVNLQVAEGRRFNVAAEVVLVNSFPKFRRNLKSISSVYQFCEVIDALTPEEVRLENVFGLLLNFLKLAEESDPETLKGELLGFQRRLLIELGFWDGCGDIFVQSFIESIIEKKLRAPGMVS